ncbi:hypothetical protein BCR36DRAFT_413049 [Piromyces finnis]|uniref:Peptidase S8 pro-domain domain-containing protein n=1 Tax=Piromyces finnis TaxID=1754191 RepID=A0A1Y1V6N7_9FUNG|nr:hypothetical protein BCR36DRAFT_413049 [Piromyces finnis]|eukprot:ORX48622.1 hypothetical protein BCR36DRAFT_413049 [Piromyces finnis]
MNSNVKGSHSLLLKIIKIPHFVVVLLFYFLLFNPNFIFFSSHTSNSEYNLKYNYSITNSSYSIYNHLFNKKSILQEYIKFYKKNLNDPLYDKNFSNHFFNLKKTLLLNHSQININDIANHYLPLYNPLQSIEILHQLFKNYTVNFNCKKTCKFQNPVDINNIIYTQSKNKTILKTNAEYIYHDKEFQEISKKRSGLEEYYNSIYRINLENLFRNYSINNIYTILKEELSNCVYCCCCYSNISNKNILNNNKYQFEFIPCYSFYKVLQNELEDIVVKLYIELLTKDNFKNYKIYSIYSTLNLDTENQKRFYKSNFDSQSFIVFLLDYISKIESNHNLYQKILSSIKIYNSHFLTFINSISNIDIINNILTFLNFDTSLPKERMSDKQYINEYAVQVTSGVNAKELAEKLGLSFGGQIGELEGYYLFKVINQNVNDEKLYKNIESKLSKEKNIEWYERQYLKSFQKRSVF